MACFNLFELGISGLGQDEVATLKEPDPLDTDATVQQHPSDSSISSGSTSSGSGAAAAAVAVAHPRSSNQSQPLSFEDYFSEDMLNLPPARRVIQWHPQQGASDDMLSVTLEQKMTRVPTMKLMFGMAVVETTQQQQWMPASLDADDGEPRLWITLCARVPPLSSSLDAGQVPLSIAVYDDETSNGMEQWAFGTFTYLVNDTGGGAGGSGAAGTATANTTDNGGGGFEDNYQLLQLLAPYSQDMPTPPHTPASTVASMNPYHHQVAPQQPQPQHQQQEEQPLSADTTTTSHHYYYTTQSIAGVLNKAHLRICGELNDMTMNWTPQEWAVGRRLVQFTRRADGETNDGHAQIACSFKPMDQQEHHQQRMRENMAAAAAAAAVAAAAAAAAGHHQQQHGFPPPQQQHPYHHQHHAAATGANTSLVVSCIYWRDRNDYFITSVDCIYLLEGLIGVQFTVEEKNRIRRNLEGFRPLTVSKCKPDCAEFFKLIMGFPHPKPRNIEKDVKVFAWKTLPHALRKIIRKYTPSYSTTSSSSSSSTAIAGGGPQRHHHHHHYTHQPPPSGMGYL